MYIISNENWSADRILLCFGIEQVHTSGIVFYYYFYIIISARKSGVPDIIYDKGIHWLREDIIYYTIRAAAKSQLSSSVFNLRRIVRVYNIVLDILCSELVIGMETKKNHWTPPFKIWIAAISSQPVITGAQSCNELFCFWSFFLLLLLPNNKFCRTTDIRFVFILSAGIFPFTYYVI